LPPATKTVEHWLRELKKSGDVEIAKGGKSVKNTRYQLTAKALQPDLPPSEATDWAKARRRPSGRGA
jgi:hypothetical protein